MTNLEYSRAQIVATLGPATHTKEIIIEMIQHQMDVARLNFSWGSYSEHDHFINLVREVALQFGKLVPIIQDLSGPRVQGKGEHHFEGGVGEILTSKDLTDLKFGLSRNVEYVAMSYVGKAEDIKHLKKLIKEEGKEAKVIAKIERKEALENFDAILKASDAIMIARGDLGNEVPLEQIPFIEYNLIQRCKKAKKPVITATQMMATMVENPVPTRAEVTDVSFAILAGSDAVMLSEETARGKYPVEAVTMMEKILMESEKHLTKTKFNRL